MAYEYSPVDLTAGQTTKVHRNVIFRGSEVPDRAFSSYDGTIEDLFGWLDEHLALPPCQAMTIPHNTNASSSIDLPGGRTPTVRPGRREILEKRARLEPLVEIYLGEGLLRVSSGTRPDRRGVRLRAVDPQLRCPESGFAVIHDRTTWCATRSMRGLRGRRRTGREPLQARLHREHGQSSRRAGRHDRGSTIATFARASGRFSPQTTHRELRDPGATGAEGGWLGILRTDQVQSRWVGRGLGAGEYARGDLRRPRTPGSLLDEWDPHSCPLLRRFRSAGGRAYAEQGRCDGIRRACLWAAT